MKIKLEILPTNDWDETNDNIDVEIITDGGQRYNATLVTIENIRETMLRWQSTRTGEDCLDGTYYWAVDLVILRDLNIHTIEKVVVDIFELGPPYLPCCQLSDTDSDDVMEGFDIENWGGDWIHIDPKPEY